MSQFNEWFCVAMLTEQALASKKMILLKKYLMKNAKNKVSDQTVVTSVKKSLGVPNST